MSFVKGCVCRQDVVCEGLGRRVPPAGRHLHAVLDRDPPARSAPVAGQGAHADGLAAQRHLERVVSWSPGGGGRTAGSSCGEGGRQAGRPVTYSEWSIWSGNQ